MTTRITPNEVGALTQEQFEAIVAEHASAVAHFKSLPPTEFGECDLGLLSAIIDESVGGLPVVVVMNAEDCCRALIGASQIGYVMAKREAAGTLYPEDADEGAEGDAAS